MPDAREQILSQDHERLDDAARRLDEYLHDTAPPVLVAEQVLELFEEAPRLAQRTLLRWAEAQYDAKRRAIPISDFYYHALERLRLFGELDLIEPEVLVRHLQATAAEIRRFCPHAELRRFEQKLQHLCSGDSQLGRPVELLHRTGAESEAGAAAEPGGERLRSAAGSGAAATPTSGEEAPVAAAETDTERGDRPPIDPAAAPGRSVPASDGREPGSGLGLDRDGSLAEHPQQVASLSAARQRPRLARGGRDHSAPEPSHYAELVGRFEQTDPASRGEEWTLQLLSAAAQDAGSRRQLRQRLRQLQGLGVEDLGDLSLARTVRQVAERMPDWYVQGVPGSPALTAAARAIERMVVFAEDPTETSQRLREIVAIAVDQFNAGHLGRALAIFEVAERILVSSPLDPAEKSGIRSSARAKLELRHFKQASREPEKHLQLRQVLDFFPDLRVETLTRRLLREEDRRRRHFIIDLLCIHGGDAREAAADLLVTSLTLTGREWPWYFVRNLIHLLRRIPAVASAISEDEVDSVVQYTDLTYAIQVVREAVAYLGAVDHPLAAEALISRFHSLIATSRELREGAEEDLAKIQSLAISQLLRVENPEARATALDYLLVDRRWSRANAQLLKGLGNLNLASDHSSRDRLLEAVRVRLPKQRWTGRLLGLGKQKEETLTALLHALGGTPTPDVSEVMAQVEELGGSEELAGLARETRERLEGLALQDDADDEAALEGDLEVFGLPSIVESLVESQASGRLTIEAREGSRKAVIRLSGGRFVDAKVGALRGVEAIYLLMEKPLAAAFRFVTDPPTETAQAPEGGPDGQATVGGRDQKPSRDPAPILLEGLRRHDELERLRLLIPDATHLEIARDKPSVPADEQEDDLVQRLWTAIKEGGMTALACDECGLADPFRVRRLLGHWLETGAIRRGETPAAGE